MSTTVRVKRITESIVALICVRSGGTARRVRLPVLTAAKSCEIASRPSLQLGNERFFDCACGSILQRELDDVLGDLVSKYDPVTQTRIQLQHSELRWCNIIAIEPSSPALRNRQWICRRSMDRSWTAWRRRIGLWHGGVRRTVVCGNVRSWRAASGAGISLRRQDRGPTVAVRTNAMRFRHWLFMTDICMSASASTAWRDRR